MQAAAADAEARCASEEAHNAKLEERVMVQRRHLQQAKQEVVRLQGKLQHLMGLVKQVCVSRGDTDGAAGKKVKRM